MNDKVVRLRIRGLRGIAWKRKVVRPCKKFGGGKRALRQVTREGYRTRKKEGGIPSTPLVVPISMAGEEDEKEKQARQVEKRRRSKGEYN